MFAAIALVIILAVALALVFYLGGPRHPQDGDRS